METAETTPLERFAAFTLRELVNAFTAELEGAADAQDVEFVHRTRVASRRVRAALTIFQECFPRKRHAELVKGVKRVTRAFGRARDLDVQIMFLQDHLSGLTGCDGLFIILDGLRVERKAAQKEVLRAIDRFRQDRVAENITDALIAGEVCAEDYPEIRLTGLAQINERIAELISWEAFVAIPDAAAQHHQMRISGKRLRYTAEIFSPAFDGGLKSSIKRLKEFQDVLGEMHDCDVWLQLLTDDKGEDGAIAGLRADRQQKRAELYSQFVPMWQELRHTHLESMRQVMRSCLSDACLGNEIADGRIGIISDVHGNLPALKAVLADAKEQGVGLFLNAGDNVGFGPFTNEVLETIRGRKVISIRGNVDTDVLAYRSEGVPSKPPKEGKVLAVHDAAKDLDDECAAFLQIMPENLRLKVGRKSVLITHASPSGVKEKITPQTTPERLAELAGMAKADVVVHGHSHMFLDKESGSVRFINPGSVGRQVDGDPRASYAIWDTLEGTIEPRRVPYRLHELLEEAAVKGWGKAKVLPHIQAIPSGEREAEVVLDREACLAACQQMAVRHGQLDRHAEHVRELSQRLFVELRELHGMGDDDLLLLECAAVMHDVGWSWGGDGHHRSSFDLILMERLPMDSIMKLRAAAIARYHRGSAPKEGHGLAFLGKREMGLIKMSAGILRVADGLDFGHSQVAEISGVRTTKGKIIVRLKDIDSCIAEVEASLRKADMLQNILGKRLEFE